MPTTLARVQSPQEMERNEARRGDWVAISSLAPHSIRTASIDACYLCNFLRGTPKFALRQPNRPQLRESWCTQKASRSSPCYTFGGNKSIDMQELLGDRILLEIAIDLLSPSRD
jgi:hypothetical protein